MLRTLRRMCCEGIEINIRPGYVDISARVIAIAVNVLKRKCQCLVSEKRQLQLQFTLFLDHHGIYYTLKTFGAVSCGHHAKFKYSYISIYQNANK